MGDGIQMGKIGRTGLRSVKWSFFIYFPFCFLLAFAGGAGIGLGTNYLQDWYSAEYSVPQVLQDGETYHVYRDEEGVFHYEFAEKEQFNPPDALHGRIFWIISNAQMVLVPLWAAACIAFMAVIFYRRELELPINDLLDASKKISDNCLDFRLESNRRDELGQLVRGFEAMRRALYRNNQETWRMLEERRRLNAAFSHDMRTPITVLKGYVDLLEKYIPDGKVSQEKLLDILERMGGQIERLESYTGRMNMMQRLEDISPSPAKVSWEGLCEKCRECCNILAGRIAVDFDCACRREWIWADEELVLEVYENILSNAIRYARERIHIRIRAEADCLEISVEDDGIGFSSEALQRAGSPFFRGQDGERDGKKDGAEEGAEEDACKHFGLGLYICRVLCEKCEGALTVTNGEMGGMVKASFGIRPE